MTDIPISDAVEEAAAKALAAVRMPNYTWNDLDRGMQKYLRSDARAALRAGLAAWPGMDIAEPDEECVRLKIIKDTWRALILPLPQEKQP